MISSITKLTRFSSVLSRNDCIPIWRNLNRQIHVIPGVVYSTVQFPSHFFSTTNSPGRESDSS